MTLNDAQNIRLECLMIAVEEAKNSTTPIDVIDRAGELARFVMNDRAAPKAAAPPSAA